MEGRVHASYFSVFRRQNQQFPNISTSIPLHQSYSSKNPMALTATVNPPPGRLQHHQGTGDAEIFILTRLHGKKPWPILLRCLSSDTTFASGRCISEMDPVWQDLFFPLQHGFPHWEEMVFGGSQNLFLFFANRSCFSTTQLDSIQIQFPSIFPRLVPEKCLLEIKLPIFTRVGSGPTSK